MELLVAIPIALFVLGAGWQVILAGHAWWALSESTRIAARTAYVVSEGDKSQLDSRLVKRATDKAAKRALPKAMVDGHKTTVAQSGGVAVSVRVPLIGPLRAVFSGGPRIISRSRIGG